MQRGRTKRVQLKWVWDILTEHGSSQGWNLALTDLFVPSSLDSSESNKAVCRWIEESPLPLSIELGTHKPVKARLWLWLEPFSVQNHLSCSLSARQRSTRSAEISPEAGLSQAYRVTSLIRNTHPPRTPMVPKA